MRLIRTPGLRPTPRARTNFRLSRHHPAASFDREPFHAPIGPCLHAPAILWPGPAPLNDFPLPSSRPPLKLPRAIAQARVRLRHARRATMHESATAGRTGSNGSRVCSAISVAVALDAPETALAFRIERARHSSSAMEIITRRPTPRSHPEGHPRDANSPHVLRPRHAPGLTWSGSSRAAPPGLRCGLTCSRLEPSTWVAFALEWKSGLDAVSRLPERTSPLPDAPGRTNASAGCNPRRRAHLLGTTLPKSGGVDGTRTRDLLRDRQAF